MDSLLKDYLLKLPTWFASFVDVISFVGFFLTIWVLWETRSLKRGFALRVRSPEIRKSLSANGTKLVALLGDWNLNQREITVLFSQTQAILDSLSEKMPIWQRGSIKRLIKRMQGPSRLYFWVDSDNPCSEKECWKIYQDLQFLTAKMQQREKDIRWE